MIALKAVIYLFANIYNKKPSRQYREGSLTTIYICRLGRYRSKRLLFYSIFKLTAFRSMALYIVGLYYLFVKKRTPGRIMNTVNYNVCTLCCLVELIMIDLKIILLVWIANLSAFI